MVITPMTRSQAAALVDRMLGCYPSVSLHDPEIYMAAVTSLLCGYSFWVGERAVADVAKSSKFVPCLAEVNEACERYAPAKSTRAWAEDWQRRSLVQLEEREAPILGPAAENERTRIVEGFRGLLERLRGGDAPRAASEFTPEAVRTKFGLSQAQWDALPDQPPSSTWAKVAAE
jgi:hypothetical protein